MSHRHVIMGQSLYKISEKNYRKALENIRDSKKTQVIPDDTFIRVYKMTEIDVAPLPNWTTISSAEAEALLLGMSPVKAGQVEKQQVTINSQTNQEILREYDPGMQLFPDDINAEETVSITQSTTNVSITETCGEGEASEAECIGEDEYQEAENPGTSL